MSESAESRVLCRVDDIPDNGAFEAPLGVLVEGEEARTALLLRQGDTVTAYVNLCPHFRLPLNSRPGRFLHPEPGQVMCSWHCAVFRFEDGLCIDGFPKGWSLDPVAIRVEDGEVRLA